VLEAVGAFRARNTDPACGTIARRVVGPSSRQLNNAALRPVTHPKPKIFRLAPDAIASPRHVHDTRIFRRLPPRTTSRFISQFP
jgi:hypothetical protein